MAEKDESSEARPQPLAIAKPELPRGRDVRISTEDLFSEIHGSLERLHEYSIGYSENSIETAIASGVEDLGRRKKYQSILFFVAGIIVGSILTILFYELILDNLL